MSNIITALFEPFAIKRCTLHMKSRTSLGSSSRRDIHVDLRTSATVMAIVGVGSTVDDVSHSSFHRERGHHRRCAVRCDIYAVGACDASRQGLFFEQLSALSSSPAAGQLAVPPYMGGRRHVAAICPRRGQYRRARMKRGCGRICVDFPSSEGAF